MAITVTLYAFTKRENSTKRPSSGGTNYSCVLIDDTSLMNPTFKLDIGSNPIGKNYCHVSDFDRYYFITEIRSYKDFWYISCTCDVLASFRNQIGPETHYVVRAASQYDEYISDTFYPTKVNEYGVHQVAANPFSWSAGHSYVIGIIGYAPNAAKQTGSVTYYHMAEGAMRSFVVFLMQNVSTYSGIALSDYDSGIQQALLNPMQYIVSCIAVPVDPPTGTVSYVRFGYYNWPVDSGLKIQAIGVADAYDTETAEIALTKHPQANTRGKYLNGSPYMKYTLHFGPFGDIALDPADLIDASAIICNLMYDLIKGTVRMVVYPKETTGNILYTGSAQIGANINISQVVKDTLGQNYAGANGVAGFIGGLLKLNPAQAAQAAFGAIESGTRLSYPTVSGTGDAGCFLPFFDTSYGLYLNCKYFQLVDENLAEVGRPLCQPKRIDTLSGFIQCDKADCTISGTFEEAQKVNSYLNGGFFYE